MFLKLQHFISRKSFRLKPATLKLLHDSFRKKTQKQTKTGRVVTVQIQTDQSGPAADTCLSVSPVQFLQFFFVSVSLCPHLLPLLFSVVLFWRCVCVSGGLFNVSVNFLFCCCVMAFGVQLPVPVLIEV